MWNCSPHIESALWKASRVRLAERYLSERALATAVERRSRIYTSERDELEDESSASSQGDLAARALFFTVADSAKVKIPLAELDAAGLLSRRRFRVLDVGAGVGGMTWGLADYFSNRDSTLEVTALDQDEGALGLMNETLLHLSPELSDGLTITTRRADLRDLKTKGSFDLILLGSALNELRESGAQKLVQALLSLLEPDGALIIIEPALRETTRALHRLRDSVLAKEQASVFAPCVRRSAPCTALENPGDWCHEDRSTQLPPRARALSARTHLREHGLKFAYLVLRHGSEPLVQDPDACRVVSSVRRLKGKHECFVCGERGRLRLRLLKREESSGNKIVRKLKRGDVIRGVSEERVSPDDEIVRLDPGVRPPGAS